MNVPDEDDYEGEGIFIEHPDFIPHALLETGSRFALDYDTINLPLCGTFNLGYAFEPCTPTVTLAQTGYPASTDTPATTQSHGGSRLSDTKRAYKAQSYTASEWEKIRPAFEDLYRNTKIILSDIVSIISERHGFHATEAMYKKHISAWGISRNLKAAQKKVMLNEFSKQSGLSKPGPSSFDAVLCKLLRHAKEVQKQPVPDTNIAGVVADLQKSIKSGRAQERKKCRGPAAEVTTGHEVSARLPNETRRISDLSINEASPLVLLFHTGHSSTSFLLSGLRDRAVSAGNYTSHTDECLTVGQSWLQARAFSAARQVFDNLDSAIEEDLKDPAPQFLCCLLFNLASSSWDEFIEIRSSLIRFMTSALEKRMGRDHPLAIFMKLFDKHSSSHYLRAVLYRSFIDQVESCCLPLPSPCVDDLRDELVRCLRRSNQFEEAMQMCKRTLEVLPVSNLRGRLNISFQLAYTELHHGQPIEAMFLLQDSYRLACTSGITELKFNTAWDLARIYKNELCDHAQGDTWLRIALDVLEKAGYRLSHVGTDMFQTVLNLFQQRSGCAQRRKAFLDDFNTQFIGPQAITRQHAFSTPEIAEDD